MGIKVIASHPLTGWYNLVGICSQLYSLRALCLWRRGQANFEAFSGSS